ncbi:MAG: NUDIX domain-containing protein [Patescibacteria group bacterium]
MEDKRKVSVLVPFRVKGDLVSVFLQRRVKNALRAPGLFGFFGGEAKNAETPEETLLREAKEELGFVPYGFRYFSTYDLSNTILTLFVILVDDDFEKRIQVLEGDYGRWFSKDDFIREKKSIMGHLPILDELYKKLSLL